VKRDLKIIATKEKQNCDIITLATKAKINALASGDF
jgi:hypothetical protein